MTPQCGMAWLGQWLGRHGGQRCGHGVCDSHVRVRHLGSDCSTRGDCGATLRAGCSTRGTGEEAANAGWFDAGVT